MLTALLLGFTGCSPSLCTSLSYISGSAGVDRILQASSQVDWMTSIAAGAFRFCSPVLLIALACSGSSKCLMHLVGLWQVQGAQMF